MFALLPTRDGLGPTHAGSSFLRAAGFDVKPLVNHSSIFDALADGVGQLAHAALDDVVRCLRLGVAQPKLVAVVGPRLAQAHVGLQRMQVNKEPFTS